jgi:hypothetical protein
MLIAAHNFQSENKYLPPYAYQNYKWTGPNATGNFYGELNNFYGLILPYVERGDIDTINAAGGTGCPYPPTMGGSWNNSQPYPTYTWKVINWMNIPVKTFQDPTDPTADPSGFTAGYATTSFGINRDAIPFFGTYVETGSSSWTSGKRTTLEGGFPDGTSQTTMIAQHYAGTYYTPNVTTGQNLNWNYPSQYYEWSLAYSSFGLDGQPAPQPHPVIQIKPNVGPNYYNPAYPNPPGNAQTGNYDPNSVGVGEYFNDVQTARASGILVGLADGSVRNLAAEISVLTWQLSVSPNDNQALGTDW